MSEGREEGQWMAVCDELYVIEADREAALDQLAHDWWESYEPHEPDDVVVLDVRVGRAHKVDWSRFMPSADDVLERTTEIAWDAFDFGMGDEPWRRATKAQRAELGERLREVFGSWLARHDLGQDWRELGTDAQEVRLCLSDDMGTLVWREEGER